MYYFLAAFAALLIAVMVSINGGLTAWYGVHLSCLIVHLCGLSAVSFAALMRREKLFSVKGIPLILFCGGAIGYFTTLFNVMAVGRISVTAILALSLLGQALTSLVIDQFGFFGMPVRKMNPSKLAGLAITIAGVVFLLWGDSLTAVVPAFVSLLTGATVVTSRQVNSQLSARTSVLTSTWYNYSVGLVTSLAALGIAALAGADLRLASGLSPSIWIYLGGPIGAVIVLLSNICVRRMSSLVMTLVMFAGQVFGGVAIDAVTTGEFSVRTLGGGIFAFCGLVLNVWVDVRAAGKAKRTS